MKKLILASVFGTMLLISCSKSENENENLSSSNSNSLSEKYSNVPKDELVESNTNAQLVYNELSSRYKTSLLGLKQAVESNGAKFSLVFLTPECGNSETFTQRKGKAVIETIVQENGIDYADLTINLSKQDPLVVTQMPKDGHLSKIGAQQIATELLELVKRFKGYSAPVSDQLNSKPSMFGDLESNQDEVLDGGKDLPYRCITNKQGLRHRGDIAFPKKKQRILLLGDSVFFCPFLDNENGISEQLQAMYPDAEIINASNWGYSVDDYLSLYNEKAKFLEADLVVVQTSGNDVTDLYFSNRLKLSRQKNTVKPDAAELNLYNELYKK